MTTQQQAYTVLQNLQTSIDAADALLAAKKFENAVQGYQAAATQSESLWNLFQRSAATDALDAQAEQVLALQWQLASKATADQAQALTKQLVAGWQAQYNAAAPLVATPAAAAPSTTTSAAVSTGVNWLLWGAVIVGIGALGYFMFAPGGGVMSNPAGDGDERGAKRKKGLIKKGSAVTFGMKSGRDIRARGQMMHDPSGKVWPANSVLVGPLRHNVRAARSDEVTNDAWNYHGSTTMKIGVVNTPPRDMARWTYVGDVDDILYTRPGRRLPGKYQHEFNRGLGVMMRGTGRVRLYRCGRFYRLQLPKNAILDSRGFVHP